MNKSKRQNQLDNAYISDKSVGFFVFKQNHEMLSTNIC